jgi:hypothetical protein
MNVAWQYAALIATALAAAALWPLTPAVSFQDAMQVRAASGITAALACGALLVLPAFRPRTWLAVAVAAALIGLWLLNGHLDALGSCVAQYEGAPVIVGRTFRPELMDYAAGNPGLSASDHLESAGGQPSRLWTAQSIESCRTWVTWGGLGTIPFFALCAAALMSRKGRRVLRAAPPGLPAGTDPGPHAPRYDAFLSYRHTEPDRAYALDLLESLERRGLRVAIDVRDFAPNEHFLSEMERCIRESRFVLCVITPRYLESDHTSEEAVISKTVDLAERRKRLVPLQFEPVQLPVWLHGLVGIDFTASATVDPLDRLVHLMKNEPARAGT